MASAKALGAPTVQGKVQRHPTVVGLRLATHAKQPAGPHALIAPPATFSAAPAKLWVKLVAPHALVQAEPCAANAGE